MTPTRCASIAERTEPAATVRTAIARFRKSGSVPPLREGESRMAASTAASRSLGKINMRDRSCKGSRANQEGRQVGAYRVRLGARQSDYLEGATYSLCSSSTKITALYDWYLDALGLRPPRKRRASRASN